MQDINQPCCGQIDGFVRCSEPLYVTVLYKFWWRAKLAVYHLNWHFHAKGFWGGLKYSFIRFLNVFGIGAHSSTGDAAKVKQTRDDESLNLQPGEWVEIKSEAEILATLDENRTYKGLRWMINMRKFCGKRYRVYKRLEKIFLEGSGEYRKIKNTVLLEGVICDGKEWYDCDRSCYHFWREVWLRRVPSPDAV